MLTSDFILAVLKCHVMQFCLFENLLAVTSFVLVAEIAL